MFATIENCCGREYAAIDSAMLREHENEHWPSECRHASIEKAGLVDDAVTFVCNVCGQPVDDSAQNELDYFVGAILEGEEEPIETLSESDLPNSS